MEKAATKSFDADIAAVWPERWRKANEKQRGASKARNNLRKAWQAHLRFQKFIKANPSAACSSCRHFCKTPHGPDFHCELDSDFHGYSIVKREYVCVRWSARKQEGK
jgi:hypothetical protein